MTDIERAVNALSHTFKAVARAMSELASVALKAAIAMRDLQRASLLCIRRDYVSAGKPYGNGYAPMMKWWRREHPELFEATN